MDELKQFLSSKNIECDINRRSRDGVIESFWIQDGDRRFYISGHTEHGMCQGMGVNTQGIPYSSWREPQITITKPNVVWE